MSRPAFADFWLVERSRDTPKDFRAQIAHSNRCSSRLVDEDAVVHRFGSAGESVSGRI